MFWKKDKSPIFVELNTNNVREAYRVTPSPDMPITLLIDEQRCRILNISSAGIAFVLQAGHGGLPETGQRLQAALIQEGSGTPPIPVVVEIVDRQDDRFRGRLTPSTSQAQKALCHYLVTHQKEEIRRQADEAGKDPAADIEDSHKPG